MASRVEQTMKGERWREQEMKGKENRREGRSDGREI